MVGMVGDDWGIGEGTLVCQNAGVTVVRSQPPVVWGGERDIPRSTDYACTSETQSHECLPLRPVS